MSVMATISVANMIILLVDLEPALMFFWDVRTSARQTTLSGSGDD